MFTGCQITCFTFFFSLSFYFSSGVSTSNVGCGFVLKFEVTNELSFINLLSISTKKVVKAGELSKMVRF